MATSPLHRILVHFRASLFRTVSVHSARSVRGRSARRSLIFGVLAFGLLTIALETAAETVKPEWRDPEYGQRLRQINRWQHQRPDRPLVLIAGSSRTQNGLSPGAMDFPDQSGSPLVYNFGYRGAHPLGMWFQVSRLLDDGVKPRVVLVQLASTELRHWGSAEELYYRGQQWGPRFSAPDAKRLAPYSDNSRVFKKDLAKARRNPWASRREALVSDLLPAWQPSELRVLHASWESMDRYGFGPLSPEMVAPASNRAEDWKRHAVTLGDPLGETSKRAMRDLLARLRGEGIAIALFWTPESPDFRKLYRPGARERGEDFARELAHDFAAPIFPAPEHLTNDDFADGYHLLPAGAAKYSQWLAETHLKPWLAEVLK